MHRVTLNPRETLFTRFLSAHTGSYFNTGSPCTPRSKQFPSFPSVHHQMHCRHVAHCPSTCATSGSGSASALHAQRPAHAPHSSISGAWSKVTTPLPLHALFSFKHWKCVQLWNVMTALLPPCFGTRDELTATLQTFSTHAALCFATFLANAPVYCH